MLTTAFTQLFSLSNILQTIKIPQVTSSSFAKQARNAKLLRNIIHYSNFLIFLQVFSRENNRANIPEPTITFYALSEQCLVQPRKYKYFPRTYFFLNNKDIWPPCSLTHQKNCNTNNSHQKNGNANNSHQKNYNANNSHQKNCNANNSQQKNYNTNNSHQKNCNTNNSQQKNYNANTQMTRITL